MPPRTTRKRPASLLNRARILTSLAVASLLIVLQWSPLHAAPRMESPLEKSEKLEVVETVLAAFENHYVYPDLARQMVQHVRTRWNRGDYQANTTLAELTEQLRHDLRDISHDGHIWVEVKTEDDLTPAIGEATPAELIVQRSRKNFGFQKIEFMSGNVGYLKLDSFDDPAYAGDTAVAAMNFLASCEAVIIDLRQNHGGHDKMVRFISSYFFAEPRLLGSLYFTATDSLEQSWSYGYVPGQKLVDVPLYILTSSATASGAEAFAYSMKHSGRATIIGERTRGAAHWSEDFDFPDLQVRVSVPIARPINPVTGTSWERTGVVPDIEAKSAKALSVARALLDKHRSSEALDDANE